MRNAFFAKASRSTTLHSFHHICGSLSELFAFAVGVAYILTVVDLCVSFHDWLCHGEMGSSHLYENWSGLTCRHPLTCYATWELIIHYLTKLDELSINEISFQVLFAKHSRLFIFILGWCLFLSCSISDCRPVTLEVCNLAKTTPISSTGANAEALYWQPVGFSNERCREHLRLMGQEV